MASTYLGSAIWLYRRTMFGTIFLLTVPETIIRSAWRGERAHDLHAKAAQIEARSLHRDHFDSAASEAKHHRPHGASAAPVVDIVDRGQKDVFLQVFRQVVFHLICFHKCASFSIASSPHPRHICGDEGMRRPAMMNVLARRQKTRTRPVFLFHAAQHVDGRIAPLSDAQHTPAFGQKIVHHRDVLVLANGDLFNFVKSVSRETVGVPISVILLAFR